MALANEAKTHAETARGLLERQRFSEAEAEFEEAVKKDPSSAQYQTGLAWTLANNAARPQPQRQRQALDLLKKIVEKYQFAEAHYAIGMIVHQQGKLAEAEAAMRQALSIDKDHHSAQRMVRLIEMRKQKEPKSETETSGLFSKFKLR
jgi:tetratricopeptide (TPR) repeat protein